MKKNILQLIKLFSISFLFAIIPFSILNAGTVDNNNLGDECSKSHYCTKYEGEGYELGGELPKACRLDKIEVKAGNGYELFNSLGELLGYVGSQSGPIATVEITFDKIIVTKIGQHDISHISVWCKEPVVVIPQRHSLVLVSICKDDVKQERRWQVFHQDESDMNYPLELGYQIESGNILGLTNPFYFVHSDATQSSNPYNFTTPLGGETPVFSLYWFGEGDSGWILSDEVIATNELCDIPDEEPIEDPVDEPVEESEEPVDDEGDVLGTSTSTTVVLAATAGGDDSLIFLIEFVLLTLTGIGFIYIGIENLKPSWK